MIFLISHRKILKYCLCCGSRAPTHGAIRVKLLFDQNLSSKLPHRLADLFPNSTHVREASLQDG